MDYAQVKIAYKHYMYIQKTGDVPENSAFIEAIFLPQLNGLRQTHETSTRKISMLAVKPIATLIELEVS